MRLSLVRVLLKCQLVSTLQFNQRAVWKEECEVCNMNVEQIKKIKFARLCTTVLIVLQILLVITSIFRSEGNYIEFLKHKDVIKFIGNILIQLIFVVILSIIVRRYKTE